MDRVDAETRSRIMQAVPRKNSKPELLVRRIAHRLGLRFRLHVKTLPGTPDIVFPRYKSVIFVHGCFWHKHPGCKLASTPDDNREEWLRKFGGNIERDRRKTSELKQLGWRVLVIWQCETRDETLIVRRLTKWFSL
jgi:DNA mismatch endonuclease (patch repair protein)